MDGVPQFGLTSQLTTAPKTKAAIPSLNFAKQIQTPMQVQPEDLQITSGPYKVRHIVGLPLEPGSKTLCQPPQAAPQTEKEGSARPRKVHIVHLGVALDVTEAAEEQFLA